MANEDIFFTTLQVVADIKAAQTQDQIRSALAIYAGQFGLTEIVTSFTCRGCEPATGLNILHAVPGALARVLLDEPAVDNDLLFQQVRERSAVVAWRSETLWDNAAFDQQALRRILAGRGLNSGVLIPVFGCTGLAGTVLMAGHDVTLDDSVVAMLELMAVYCFNRAMVVHRAVIREKYGLSVREVECMNWVAGGKTDWEIGQILSISPKTVNYHVENAKRKMAVPTRVQAVVAVILSGDVLS